MPVISNLVYTATDTTIVATWTTDVSSNSSLYAGTKAAIDNGVAANSTSHQAIVTGLLPNTGYSCYVTSGGTSSSPQSVTTNVAQTRTPPVSATFGTTTIGTVHGDSLNTFVSSDNNTYGFLDDVYSSPFNSNMAFVEITNESTLAISQVNALSAYGTSATTNGTDGPSGAPMSNKLSGIFGMGGNVYLFQTRTPYGSPQPQFFANIMQSENHGTTWNSWQAPGTYNANGIPPSPLGSYQFSDPDYGWCVPVRYAVDDGTLGYNTAGNQIDGANGWVYIICTDGNWQDASNIYLQRVPRIQMAAQSTGYFEWWIGPSSPTPAQFVNDSYWSTSETGKTAIYSAASQCSAPDMIFIPTLNYYVFMNWYQVGGVSSNTIWEVLAGPTPAGPWVQIGSQQNKPAGWYNPTVMHRTAATNSSATSVPLKLTYSGDYNNQPTYYYPSYSTMTLTTAAPTFGVANFITGGTTSSVSSFSSSAWSSTSGNLLVVGIRIGETLGFVTSVKTQAGTSLTAIAGSAAYNGSSQATQLFYLPNIVGNSIEQITVALSNPTAYVGICVWEIHGALISSVLDKAAEGVNASSATTVTTGAFTTTHPIEIICAMGGMPTLNNTYSGQAGYTMDSTGWPSGATALYCGAEHLITSSIQTGATVSLTGTVAGTGSTLSLASFIAALSISGNAGVANAVVTWTGTSSGYTIADGSGNFAISGLANGSYTITPSLAGYTFSPTSSAQTVNNANITGVNFTATPIPPASSGGGFGFGFSFRF